MRLLAIVLLLTAALKSECSSIKEPIVKLPSGRVRGKFENGLYFFHNIPYAHPPIGSRRIAAPQPYKETWPNERDASQPIINCIRFGNYSKSYGSEDCLYLHITTPTIICEQTHSVRFHIHGGGFMIGSPDSSDTSILAKLGVVVVTMGYRLGPLGFLSTGDKVISGNMGLKDQRLAMEWTKANIRSFCGDPNRILITGVSAGGSSAHIHLLRKSTENYANSVASHNGVITCPWSFTTKQKEVTKLFAGLLDCPIESDALKKCLQNKTTDDLKKATAGLQYYRSNPFTVFAPVVEAVDSEDPFITEHPEEIMRNGKTANLTWLVAYTEREGSCNAADFLGLDHEGRQPINYLNDRWIELAPHLLFFNFTKSRRDQDEYSRFLRNKYLANKEFSAENYGLLENMYSDVLFKNDIEAAIELHRKYCPGKVYVHYYKYPHTLGLGNLITSRNDISFGADHMADTIFTIPLWFVKPKNFSERDEKVSKKLLDMFVNWGNTGDLIFGGKEVPLSTPVDSKRLTINENCFSVDDCTDENESGCDCYPYD